MKISVQWLQDFIKLSPPLERIAENLTLAGLEVKKLGEPLASKEGYFEIEITSNRPDWLSHLGVAREISAIENLPLKLPAVDEVMSRQAATGWKINVKEQEGCPYYSGVLIEGISIEETPDFIKDRLALCGVRSINLIVDITNYVLLETGQPLHAFDADLIKGKEIRVRPAKNGETMMAIDGRKLELKAQDLVIADAERPIALAGVMGGSETEVSHKSRNIFLESAFFQPRWVRQMSRKHALSTESSYRFERRVDPEGVDFGRDRALWLIKKYAKPRFVSSVIKSGQKPNLEKPTVLLSSEHIEKTLGTSVKPHQVASILTRLGLQVTSTSAKSWKTKIPSFRADLTRPVDLVEEVARIYGFDHLPETLPERSPLFRPENKLQRISERARDFFSGAGFFETVTFSLVSQKGFDDETLKRAVRIVNPQNKELVWMRPFLFASLTEVIRKNQHASNHDVFIFEIANVYGKSDSSKHSEEEKTLGLAMCGDWKPKSWLDASRGVTFFDLKGVLQTFFDVCGIRNFTFHKAKAISHLNPFISEVVMVDKKAVGYVGQLSDSLQKEWGLENPVILAELSLPALSEAAAWVKRFRELPKFPAIKRDLSLTIPETVNAGDIIKMIKEHGKGLVDDVEVFDLFRGGRIPKGCKNVGFRVTYRSAEKTLISSEIQALHASIASELVKYFQAAFQ